MSFCADVALTRSLFSISSSADTPTQTSPLFADFADTTRYAPATYPGIIVSRLLRQDKLHVLDVVTALVPHLVDEAALRGRLWIVEETRIRMRE